MRIARARLPLILSCNEPLGHNNGNPHITSSNADLAFGAPGRRYFVCKPWHGIFVRKEDVHKVLGATLDWNGGKPVDRALVRQKHDEYLQAGWLRRARGRMNSAQAGAA